MELTEEESSDDSLGKSSYRELIFKRARGCKSHGNNYQKTNQNSISKNTDGTLLANSINSELM